MTLTQQQMTALQDAIEQRRKVLEEELGQDAAAGAGRSDADEADVERDVAELHALQAADARIVEGSYGACVECGADVGYQRLSAAPHAERCIDCQRRHEKTHAGSHASTL